MFDKNLRFVCHAIEGLKKTQLINFDNSQVTISCTSESEFNF